MTSRALLKADLFLQQSEALGPILAVDTSQSSLVASLAAYGRVLAEMELTTRSYAAKLPEVVGELLEKAGVRFSELQGVAAGTGPGSFTGVRIGISYAKGIAYAMQCAIVGVSTLDSLVVSAFDNDTNIFFAEGTLICPLIDARRGECYSAFYRMDHQGAVKISSDLVINPLELAGQLETNYAADRVVLLSEQSLKEFTAEVLKALPNKEIKVVDNLATRAKALVALGAAKIAMGERDSIFALEPSYVREPQVLERRALDSMEKQGD